MGKVSIPTRPGWSLSTTIWLSHMVYLLLDVIDLLEQLLNHATCKSQTSPTALATELHVVQPTAVQGYQERE